MFLNLINPQKRDIDALIAIPCFRVFRDAVDLMPRHFKLAGNPIFNRLDDSVSYGLINVCAVFHGLCSFKIGVALLFLEAPQSGL